MRRLLVDADAFINLRTLSVLNTALSIGPPPRVILSRIVRDELSTLDREINAAEAAKQIEVVQHLPTKKGLYFKLKAAGADPGEAEAIAWKADECDDDEVVFVTCDRGATKLAAKHIGGAWDVFDVVLWLIAEGFLNETDAKAKLARWNDPHQSIGRPPDFSGFDATAAARRKRAGE